MANNILRPRIAGSANRLYPAGYTAGEAFYEDLKIDIQVRDFTREYLKTEVDVGEHYHEDLKINIQAGVDSLIGVLQVEVEVGGSFLESLKTEIKAGAFFLEDLKTEAKAGHALLEDAKIEIQAGIDSLQDLKCFADVKHIYDTGYDFLKTDVRSKSQFVEELKTEIATGKQFLVTGLVTDIRADYGHDVVVGFLGWRPDPHDFEKNVRVDKRILFKLKDKMSGIDIDTVWVKVNGAVYRKGDVQFKYEGWRREYTISIRPDLDWEYGQEVNVEVYAEDLAGNPGLAVEIL